MEKFVKKIAPYFMIIGLIGSILYLYGAIQSNEYEKEFSKNMTHVFMYLGFAYIGLNITLQKIKDKNLLNKIRYFMMFLLSYGVLCFVYFMYFIFKNGLSNDLLTLVFDQIFGFIIGILVILAYYFHLKDMNEKVKD